jgi:cytochrome c oxidase subunit 3
MGSNVVNFQKHPFHLVDPSPWPLLSSRAALTMTSGGVMWFHNYSGGGYVLLLGFFFLIS